MSEYNVELVSMNDELFTILAKLVSSEWVHWIIYIYLQSLLN